MAMNAGFDKLGVLKENIFRMVAEADIEENALRYEEMIREKLPGASFDLVMLGMGDDGHTASLFPHTKGLHVQKKLVTANYIPSLQTWRLSLTFDCINAAKTIAIYVIGKGKQQKLKEVFTQSYDPEELPIQKIGTLEHRALWILDLEAAEALLTILGNSLNEQE
jgi:6-phosphogluconolactonase